MGDIIKIKSIHIDSPEGKKRVRVKLYNEDKKVHYKYSFNTEVQWTRSDFVKWIKGIFPKDIIQDIDKWPKQ